MKAPSFSYQRATTLDDTLRALDLGDDLRLLAGGQSLLPMLNMRLLRPQLLLDIGTLSELRSVRRRNGSLVLGALATYRDLETSPAVAADAPLLHRAVGHVGDLQVRNRGTVGGSLAQADPTAELPLACLVMGGAVDVAYATGSRSVPLAEFLVGSYETALEPNEMVTAVTLPVRNQRVAFAEATRRHNDFAIVSAAAAGVLGPDGTFTDITVGLGGVDDTVVLVPRASAVLRGQRPDEDVLATAMALCREEIDPGGATASLRRLPSPSRRRVPTTGSSSNLTATEAEIP